jgi:hypothetical protein
MTRAPSASIQVRLTPLKLVIAAVVLLLLIGVLLSWAKTSIPFAVDTKWSKPVPMDNVICLCHWNGTAVAIGSGGVLRILNQAGQWEEKSVAELEPAENGSCLPLFVDREGPDAMFLDVRFSNKVEAVHSLVPVTMTPPNKPVAERKIPLQVDADALFGKPGENAGFTREVHMLYGGGFVDGAEFYVPYAACSDQVTERITSTGTHQKGIESGPSQRGFLWSGNRGRAWQLIPLAQLNTAGQSGMYRVGSTDCYLAADFGRNLWVLTKGSTATNWSQPALLCGTLNGSYLATAAERTLHLCWMDMRLKKGLGSFIYGDSDVGRKNNQVYYRHYRDSDGKWSKGIKLSGSLSYCERPTMSVEGERIVVAWHNLGEKRGITRRISPYASAAIYYAASKDAGRTWSSPSKIEHSEDSAGNYPCPNVILHQKVIHVFYNGIYQRRDFPE